MLRLKSGRAAQSSVRIIDAQSSSKTSGTAREAVSFDGGKKVKGRKRYLLVDSLGLLIVMVVSRGRCFGNRRSKSGVGKVNPKMVENETDLA